jgi:Mg2+ and Co2+ transporter CorA
LFTQKQDERLERKRAITRSLYRSYYPKDYFEKYIQAFPEFKIAPREEQAKVIEAFKKELIRAVNLKDEDRKILNDLLAQYVKANNHKANSTNNKSNQKANSKSNQKVQRRR